MNVNWATCSSVSAQVGLWRRWLPEVPSRLSHSGMLWSNLLYQIINYCTSMKCVLKFNNTPKASISTTSYYSYSLNSLLLPNKLPFWNFQYKQISAMNHTCNLKHFHISRSCYNFFFSSVHVQFSYPILKSWTLIFILHLLTLNTSWTHGYNRSPGRNSPQEPHATATSLLQGLLSSSTLLT